MGNSNIACLIRRAQDFGFGGGLNLRNFADFAALRQKAGFTQSREERKENANEEISFLR